MGDAKKKIFLVELKEKLMQFESIVKEKRQGKFIDHLKLQSEFVDAQRKKKSVYHYYSHTEMGLSLPFGAFFEMGQN